MGGSEYENIRDDHFYTSLLLGCRRGAAASGPSVASAPSASSASSSASAASDKTPSASSIAVTKTTSTLSVDAATLETHSNSPRPGFQHVNGSPDSGTATSAGESSPTASPSTDKARDSRHLDADESHRQKRLKQEKTTGPTLARASSTKEEGDATGFRWTAHHASSHKATRDVNMTPTSMQWSSSASITGSTPGSVNNSSKSESQDASGAPQRKTKRRFRKATHTIRKEEKEHLLTEISQLEAHIAGLKKRAISATTSPDENERDKLMATWVLRDAVQTQQREFAKIQAMMSEYTLCNIRAGSPLQTAIRLKRDESDRRHALTELKHKKLQDAKQFLARRRPSLNPCKPMCEDHRYELPNGDFCSTRFTTIQFEGVHSVRQVFDLLVEYFCNIEICISEKLGHITIREDDDRGGVGITENCLVSRTNSGLLMESNTVLFSEFYDPDDGFGHEQGHGLIVAEFVDEDERHPYHPRERIRRDVSTILELTSYTRTIEAFGKHFPVNPLSQPQEVVVVMTRWVYSKLRYPKFPIARSAWEELRDNVDRWGETMHRTLVESLRTSSTALP